MKKLTPEQIVERLLAMRERNSKCCFENGYDLIDFQRSLPEGETWKNWVVQNVEWSASTVENFIRAAKLKDRCTEKKIAVNFTRLRQSSVFDLAREGTPIEAVKAVAKLSGEGLVPHQTVLDIIEKHKSKTKTAASQAPITSNTAPPQAQVAESNADTVSELPEDGPADDVVEPDQNARNREVVTSILGEMIPPIVARLDAELPEVMKDLRDGICSPAPVILEHFITNMIRIVTIKNKLN